MMILFAIHLKLHNGIQAIQSCWTSIDFPIHVNKLILYPDNRGPLD